MTEVARSLRLPTLVLHSHGDAAVPFAEGRLLAALIPGARFVPVNSVNHVLLASEPAWPGFVSEVRAFLQPTPEQGAAEAARSAALTPAELAVLRLIARGLDNTAIAAELGKSEKTVRNQVSSIFDKLGVHTRAQAIVRVRDGRPDL